MSCVRRASAVQTIRITASRSRDQAKKRALVVRRSHMERRVQPGETEVPMPSPPYVIVVALDLLDTSKPALERALEIGLQRQSAVIHAVHVLPVLEPAGMPAEVAPPSDRVYVDAARKLREFIEPELQRFPVRSPPTVERVFTHVRAGRPAREIVQLASDLEADEVVVGTHGRRGLSRLILGSVAEEVLRTAPCSVLAIRPKGQPSADQPVPAFAPPCPNCLETRKATHGEKLWCDQHAQRHGRRHQYHYTSRGGTHSSGFLIH